MAITLLGLWNITAKAGIRNLMQANVKGSVSDPIQPPGLVGLAGKAIVARLQSPPCLHWPITAPRQRHHTSFVRSVKDISLLDSGAVAQLADIKLRCLPHPSRSLSIAD